MCFSIYIALSFLISELKYQMPICSWEWLTMQKPAKKGSDLFSRFLIYNPKIFLIQIQSPYTHKGQWSYSVRIRGPLISDQTLKKITLYSLFTKSILLGDQINKHIWQNSGFLSPSQRLQRSFPLMRLPSTVIEFVFVLSPNPAICICIKCTVFLS